MESSPELHQQIQYALARGWTVLTANQRAARALRHAFDLHQHESGLANWQPPPIFDWDTWLASLWRQLLLEGRTGDLLLNSTQEHTIWREIIAADSATSSLRPIDSLAETAASAWLLLHAYRGRSRLRNYTGNGDTRVFARWLAEFERRCIRGQYLTEAQLPETIRTAIASAHITLPAGLLLVGFDSKTQAQNALLEAVSASSSSIEELEHGEPASGLSLASAPTERTELTACARWLRMRLTEQPDSRLAVIVPALEDCRAEIDRIFRQVLAPELNDIDAAANSGPFEFSLGVPLAQTPMVATALDLLRWAMAPLPLERVSALLLSPHFAADSGSESLSRAEFDTFVLRNQHLLEPRISLEALCRLVSNPRHNSELPILLTHLQALRPLCNRKDLASGERAHADWAATIHELLEAAGWAVPSHLDSVEFQTRRKWESALDELATLDFDSGRVSFVDAIAALERSANETLFAPESRHAPVQIMGPLESAGSTFDAIWFLRANDIEWPGKPAPNPLLPWQLQRDLAMPGANPSVDSALARRITERIAASAPIVTFSYAHESADGPQRRSPVLSGLTLETFTDVELTLEATSGRIELEIVEDNDSIPPPPDSALRGGASILQAQAACAFRAFAEKRLFASVPETIELGLDARERGNIIHKILELFWTEVRTQEALTQMPDEERDRLLVHFIDSALAAQNSRVDPGWPKAYFATERQRLKRLLISWLDFELTRPAFTVKAMEQQLHDVQIGRIRLDVRVDRIDTSLVDGEEAGEIILDYKTGAASPAEWLSDRPDAPQLPLYAVVSGIPDIAGIAFASVRPGKQFGLKGYQSRGGVLPKGTKLKTDSLDAQVRSWREVLTVLANDFHAGDARVSPKQYPSTCRDCEQRLLCRLDLSTLAADANEDFASDADLADDSTEALEVERG